MSISYAHINNGTVFTGVDWDGTRQIQPLSLVQVGLDEGPVHYVGAATTNGDGRYEITFAYRSKSERRGHYTLSFSKPGYQTKIVDLEQKSTDGNVRIERSFLECLTICRTVDIVLTPDR